MNAYAFLESINLLLFIRFQDRIIHLAHSCDYSTRRSDPWSTVQIVLAIPTSSILPSQDLMSTTFFKLILQNLKINKKGY